MRCLAGVLTALALLSLPAGAQGAVAHAGQPVMGTVLQVTIIAADQATADTLAHEAIATARHWDDVLTTWRPEGELARLNASAGRGDIAVSADLVTALAHMERLSAATGGAFDPAVGPLVDLWRRSAPPSSEMLAALGPYRLSHALRRRDGRVALAPGAALDAGGIGKGLALDAIAGALRRAGVHAAFLDFGGSSQLAIGAPPDNADGWRIVVGGLDRGDVLGTLTLRDASLSTSRALGAGADAGPIIDPLTAQPVVPPRLATVLAPDATTAEAWSKAAIVFGRDSLTRCAAHRVEALLADTQGVARTPNFPLHPAPPN